MELNLPEIAKELEKEKCSFHKYRAMVFVENTAFKIIGCCKSFENLLETKAREMMEKEVYEPGKSDY